MAERNELRSLPLTAVLLRIEADADPDDVVLCTLAAETTGVRLLTSRSPDEPIAALAARLATEPVDRVRVLGTVPEALWSVAADAWIHLDDRTPVADGEIELRRWSHEQAISRTAHRHGRPVIRQAPAPPSERRSRPARR